MSTRTVFLAWNDKRTSRKWFPIGRLDADVEHSEYRFRYIGGAERAQQEVGFPPTLDFPDLHKDYRSPKLFAMFGNRVIARGRPDRLEYLDSFDLPEEADSIDILSVNGGYRVTDAFEVFPKIKKRDDGSFRCRFFLHGWRHMNKAAQERINELKPDEKLAVVLECQNGEPKVQLHTLDHHLIGRVPHYLVDDLTKAMADTSGKYTAHVVKLSPLLSPTQKCLLVELSGHWDKHEPMSGPDFKPLVGE